MALRFTFLRLLWVAAFISFLPMFMIYTAERRPTPSGPTSEVKKEAKKKPGDRKDLIESNTLPANWSTSEEHLQELDSRRQNVIKVCHDLGLDTPSPSNKLNAWEFIINTKYNLVWCNIFKAASSTWFWNFNTLAGYTEDQLVKANVAPVQLARNRYPRPKVEELQAVLTADPAPISFMITRHPFERLVSAYRNKILAGNRIYIKLFNTIYTKYKHLGPPVPRRNKDGQVVGRNVSPSFSQFVQYVLDEEAKGVRLDMHWIPQSRFCTPCLANFSIFAKTETLVEDGNHIIFSSGINNIIKPKTINRAVGMPTSSVTTTYMCQLSQKQYEGLLTLYSLDFKLFQYDGTKYRGCAM